jgi:D-glycero-alpha-D-manno-heptose-7-phosphate kinase
VKEITQDYFDVIYDKAIAAGSIGGKLLGAGGGGFFLFYVSKEKREQVIEAITKDSNCKIYDFRFHGYGSRIIASG